MAQLQILLGLENNELSMAVVSLSIAILFILCYKLIVSSSTLPPGPRSLPIVGYFPFLGPHLPKQFFDMSQKYGPIFKFYLGSKLNIVVNTTELAKAVLRDQDETFANRQLTVAASVITKGGQDIVFSNRYAENLRKIFVNEVISSKNLMASGPIRRDEVRNAIKFIYDKIGTAVNFKEVTFQTVTKVVTRMIWESTSDREQKDSYLGAELEHLASKISELLGKPNLSDIFPILAWFDFQGIERDSKKQCDKLDQVMTSMIEDRIKSNSKKLGHEGRKDFLQVLLELKEQKVVNLNQMKGLIQDFIIAGTHTTTTMVEWAMAEIIKNHKVMKRIEEELLEVVGINNIVEESHLSKLKYLYATTKETFRLHPASGMLLPRSASKDCMVGGYTIPKGATLLLNIWAIHRDPQYWINNPTKFDPERFLTYEGTNKCELRGNNLFFIPFGSGRRMCPAVPFADKMLMYILASFLHSFNWNLPQDGKHDLSEKYSTSLEKVKPLIVIPSQKLPNGSLYM